MKEIPVSIHTKILNSLSDGFMLIRPNGEIQFANVAMERITGHSLNQLCRADCSILNCDVCDKARSGVKKAWCSLFENGKGGSIHCLIERKDGSFASVKKTAKLIRDENNKVYCALEIFTELSDSRTKKPQSENHPETPSENKGFCGMVGRSPAMQQIFQTIEKVAEGDAPVIITGETGTGKELVAKALHDLGRRRENPFIQFNCAALNESLCESELFGHTRGAFTGAHRHRKGRFEEANLGDIFLDEIGEVSLNVQSKLLRVLETKQFERVGDNKSLCVDVRIIAATNKNLFEMIQQEKFREDLFYRINVIPIHLPPLRDRKEDMPLLVQHFINLLRQSTKKPVISASPDVMELFMRYTWPGNIRELKSTLEYAFVLASENCIEFQHLPIQIKTFAGTTLTRQSTSRDSDENPEKKKLIEALCQSNGNKTKAGKILGVHRMTVCNRMKKYGLELTRQIENEKRL